MTASYNVLKLGAVAYAPKVITIWEGFKAHFIERGMYFDYVLYSNYESLTEALMSGDVQLAWNSPLAFVRADLMARAAGQKVESIAMRDTDLDVQSLLVVSADSPVQALDDLRGRTVGFGAIDSPQATLIPLDHLRQAGMVAGKDYTARRFDVLGGKHGDHIGGERDAAKAMVAGEIHASWMVAKNFLAFAAEGTLPAGKTRVLATSGAFDHCNMTSGPSITQEDSDRFRDLLLGMSWDDPKVRPLLELEGLKVWHPGRATGYQLLERAVRDEQFYDGTGRITVQGYKY
ncbi:phosphate/phosphite/phosphonate ABC transporter substrate-binding protein [Diaphorobacter sp. HDW4A]|uniref:phosphate/phosphite/phosphonate ABC transporter substrate-binding protein n=1 Tax=Diaphorobacter sp. HDW4A TaxID=2714924 RepID=UPI00140A489A|nr:PhnD/SsuA/transferrin family substrate-binding protein [Diaphorobacter sp. HDW4A]QIL81039.1 phosphate/phosphite/phosphonate ABC transporter substrate-binding protein [Diaphorobacter sp. HDW4A]